MQVTVACAGLVGPRPATRLTGSRSRLQGLRASLQAAHARSGRRALNVQANELNKWCVQERSFITYWR